MQESEIQAIISLLDDEDKEVVEHIEKKIISLGDIMIPFLEREWETNFNPIAQKRIEELIHILQLKSLKEKLINWKNNEQNDLLKGMYLVATYQYPDLDIRKLKKELDKIYYEAWLKHRTYASPIEQIRTLNHVLFNELGFTSNTQNFHAPSNSMLNVILESRKSNPIGLSVVYILIAQRLMMPVYGVNFPNLFILTYKSSEVQFYINAFHRGMVFFKNDIDNYINQLNIKPLESFYQPCSNLDIIQRVLRNLIVSFEKLGETHREEEVKQLLDAISQEGDGFLNDSQSI
ncbi:MAG: transglutaminase-like domain-containing protein [Microscillaceae bacterium]|nr:transglutaminase-like domain-containing protein [Microscillaceae bacterium]MDW8460485.1 transglutaminase-like domain-containing protein [Cytophagales bacterium]